MPGGEQDLLDAFETHDVDHIAALLDHDVDARAPIRGKSPVQWLIEMYTRSDRFPDCLRVLLERGATIDDPAVLPVLLDDATAVRSAAEKDPQWLGHRTTLVSAFTPLIDATLLHVAAEYGHLAAARALIELGADVDARAGVDEHGLNGHTPLFHTVNSNANRSLPVLDVLLAAGASPDVRLAGIVWGKGFEWETAVFDVTPLSYAQLGLLPQMHRREEDVYVVVQRLLEAGSRPIPPLANVPNRYVDRSRAR